MGKNSLIKSTSKKKKNLKKPEDAKQPENKSAAAVAVESEPAAKPEAKTASPKKEIPKAEAVKPTYKDLIFKNFADRQPEKHAFPGNRETKQSSYESPPFYPAAIQAEIRQFKALLFKKFDLTSPVEIAVETAVETNVPTNVRTDGQKAPVEENAVIAPVPVEAAETAPVQRIEQPAMPVKPTPPLKRMAPDQKVTVSYGDGKAAKASDPRDNMMKLAVALVAFFVLAVVGASFSNHGTYWLVSKNGNTEVWQGRFGPMGKVLLMTIPDAVQTDKGKTSGSKKEIFPAIVAWHLNTADKGLEIAGTPDFKEIRSLLQAAAPFTVTPELKKEILVRSNVIDLMALLYKAQVAAGLETSEGFERALAYLQEAKALQSDEIQMDLVSKKISEMDKKLAGLGLPVPGPEPEKGK